MTEGGIKGLDLMSPALGDARVQYETKRAEESARKVIEASQSGKVKQIDKALSGFEGMLLNEMFKAMWSSVESSGLFGGKSNEAQIYQSMLIQGVADESAKGKGIGIKQELEKELARKAKGREGGS